MLRLLYELYCCKDPLIKCIKLLNYFSNYKIGVWTIYNKRLIFKEVFCIITYYLYTAIQLLKFKLIIEETRFLNLNGFINKKN